MLCCFYRASLQISQWCKGAAVQRCRNQVRCFITSFGGAFFFCTWSSLPCATTSVLDQISGYFLSTVEIRGYPIFRQAQRFPQIGVPPCSSSIFAWDFPWNKPSSYFLVPPFWETSIWIMNVGNVGIFSIHHRLGTHRPWRMCNGFPVLVIDATSDEWEAQRIKGSSWTVDCRPFHFQYQSVFLTKASNCSFIFLKNIVQSWVLDER